MFIFDEVYILEIELLGIFRRFRLVEKFNGNFKLEYLF